MDSDASGACDGSEFVWQYDAHGNLLNDGAATYTYDAANRLSSVINAPGTTTYTYNGDGDRISQTVNGTLTTYTLDTATPLTMVLAETSNGQTIHYLHGLDLVAQSDGMQTAYFAYDGLGSVRQLVDSVGGVTLAQTFDPYGNGYSKAGSVTTSFGYSGEQIDGNGFVYLRARYYNPAMGRFFEMDPSRQERNPYLYVLGNPIMYTDSSDNVVCPPDLSWFECTRGGTNTEDLRTTSIAQIPPPIQQDETTYPAGIVFDPSIEVGLAPGLPTNTQQVTDEWGNPIEPAQFALGTTHACGVAALAMVLQTDTYKVLDVVLDTLDVTIDDFGGLNGDQLVTVIEEHYSEQFSAEAVHLAIPKTGSPPAPDSVASNKWADKLRSLLRNSRYPLALVTIDGSRYTTTRGRLRPAGTGALHWVVVTGISHQEQWSSGPPWQWIRVNNPFDNQQEYYLWAQFSESLSNLDPNLVRISRK